MCLRLRSRELRTRRRRAGALPPGGHRPDRLRRMPLRLLLAAAQAGACGTAVGTSHAIRRDHERARPVSHVGWHPSRAPSEPANTPGAAGPQGRRRACQPEQEKKPLTVGLLRRLSRIPRTRANASNHLAAIFEWSARWTELSDPPGPWPQSHRQVAASFAKRPTATATLSQMPQRQVVKR